MMSYWWPLLAHTSQSFRAALQLLHFACTYFPVLIWSHWKAVQGAKWPKLAQKGKHEQFLSV